MVYIKKALRVQSLCFCRGPHEAVRLLGVIIGVPTKP